MDNLGEETPPTRRNPFSERKVLHPALSVRPELGPDAWKPLWNGLLESDVFGSWQNPEYQWMLRCVGGPGSGKTHLSAVVTKRLEESYNEDTEAVASIFIGADVTSSGTAFVEDVLTSVFLQLSAKYADVDVDMANAKYQLYLEAWKHGHRDRHRIRLVREALCLRLDMLENKFLIIDDFDRCYPTVDLFLEDELSHLATRGLRVFLTSRISCLEEFPLSATCDFCQKESLKLFWGCESCDGKGVQHENTYTLCEDCVYNEEACEKCGDSDNFVQPYGHIDLNLNDNGRVEQFINHDLETEHGDLGLGSSTPDKLPPHSRLGRQLAATENGKALTELQGKLVKQAEGNVSLARLRLDNEHQAQSTESVFSPLADVLPVNIVGFFRAGMRRVEEQPPERRDLGFKVIAAVTHYNYGLGIPYEALDRLLRNPTKTLTRQQPLRTQSAPVVSGVKRKAGPDPAPTHVPHRSLEEMLHAACGFVVMVPLGNRPLRAYSEAFHEYARHYHEDLRWAHAQLDFDSVRVDEQGNVSEQGNLAEFGDEGLKRRGTFQIAKSGREGQMSDQNMKPFIPQKSDGGSRSSALKRQEFRRLRGAEFKLPVISDAFRFDSDGPVIMPTDAVADAANVTAPKKKKLSRASTQAFV
ncbi:ankyrin repeat-containing protein [Colletotrichum asianum]|uniref:Ankyrin repeat-containing protein n=1 Tax=Colletotrichum asianum TaxID=702518 RepID=A0A8H3WQI2_9PEZI|nr:ankyrin repeat-containing protein [Colletotrichum asianum]